MFKIILLSTFLLTTNEIFIGEISFKVVQKGTSDRRYIWLHGDEQTAKMALENHMSSNQGIAYFINNNKREVYISDGMIDPNRIFSSIGAKKNIHKYNPQWSTKKRNTILKTMDQDRENFLETIFPKNGEVVIALHNNFKGYNVNQELSKSDTVSTVKILWRIDMNTFRDD